MDYVGKVCPGILSLASQFRVLRSGCSCPGAAGAVGLFGGGDPILLAYRPAAVRLLHLGLGHVDPADPVGLADVHPRPPSLCSTPALARSGVTGSSGNRTSARTRYLLIVVGLAPSRCSGHHRRIQPSGRPSSALITSRLGAPEDPRRGRREHLGARGLRTVPPSLRDRSPGKVARHRRSAVPPGSGSIRAV
jgi:hypothetical protein